MTRALVLRHHVEDDAGLVGRALENRGFEITTIMVNAMTATIDVDNFEIVVVLGSNSAVYDPIVRSEWFDEELVALQRADALGSAILGVCFGAQALCVLFGGVVEPAPRGEQGWLTIDVDDGCDISTGPWFEYHEDHCLVSDQVQVLARTKDAVQVFRVGRHLGVQFHPEIDDVQLAKWFASEAPEGRAHSPRQAALLDQTRRETPEATRRTAQLVDYFLRNANITL